MSNHEWSELEGFLRQQPGFAQVERAIARRYNVDVSEVPISMSASAFSFVTSAAAGEMTLDEALGAMASPDTAMEAMKKLLQSRGLDTSDLEREESIIAVPEDWVDITEDWRNFMLEGGEPGMAYSVSSVHYNPDGLTDGKMVAGMMVEPWVDEDHIPEKMQRKMAMAMRGAIQKWRKDNGLDDLPV